MLHAIFDSGVLCMTYFSSDYAIQYDGKPLCVEGYLIYAALVLSALFYLQLRNFNLIVSGYSYIQLALLVFGAIFVLEDDN